MVALCGRRFAGSSGFVEAAHSDTEAYLFSGPASRRKGLKSVLIASQARFPFHHDLDELRNLIPTPWSVRDCAADLSELTEWAVEARYPTYEDDPTAEDAQRAVEQASIVVSCVRRDFQVRSIA